jgi:hypothetical protein
MPKTSRQILFSAVAVSVSAFAVGRVGIVSEHSRLLAALAPEGASTVAAKALVVAPGAMPLGLPDAKEAKAVLSASLIHHHPQWIDVPMGASMIRTFVIYPDLSGTLPSRWYRPDPGDERLGTRRGDGGGQRRLHHRCP